MSKLIVVQIRGTIGVSSDVKDALKHLKPGWGLLPVAIFLVVWELVARLNLIPGHITFPAFSA